MMVKNETNKLIKFVGILKNKKSMELLEGALTRGLDKDEFVKCAWIQIQSNEGIREVAEKNPESLFRAMLQLARLGLYADGITGDAYLVPFSSKGKPTAVAVRGYRGMIRIFSENNADAAAVPMVFDSICENDKWEYARGAHPRLEHEPAKTDRGKVTHYYAVARFRDGTVLPKVMDVETVETFAKYSKSKRFWDSEHENTRQWMRQKTVIRQLFKELPIPAHHKRALAQDEEVDLGDVELVEEPERVYGAEIHKTEAVAVVKKEQGAQEDKVPEKQAPDPLGNPEPEQEIPNHPPTTEDWTPDDDLFK